MTLMAAGASGGFSVRSGALVAGASQVLEQQQRCAQVATAVAGLIAQMAGSAGHQELADALVAASESGARAYTVGEALYERVADGLQNSAGEYDRAEQAATQQAQAVMGSLW